jgi:hypothetical protein
VRLEGLFAPCRPLRRRPTPATCGALGLSAYPYLGVGLSSPSDLPCPPMPPRPAAERLSDCAPSVIRNPVALVRLIKRRRRQCVTHVGLIAERRRGQTWSSRVEVVAGQSTMAPSRAQVARVASAATASRLGPCWGRTRES